MIAETLAKVVSVAFKTDGGRMTVGELAQKAGFVENLARSIDTGEVAPLLAAAAGALGVAGAAYDVAFAPWRTEYAGFFSGADRGLQALDRKLTELGLKDASAAPSPDPLRALRLDGVVKGSTDHVIELFVTQKLDWNGLATPSHESLDEVLARGGTKVVQFEDRGALEAALRADLVPTAGATAPELSVAVRDVHRLVEMEQQLLAWADAHGCVLTAKRVDYVIGSTYVKGAAADLPLVGHFVEIFHKTQLGVEVTPEDWLGAGLDAAMIVTLVATPLLLPAGAVGSGVLGAARAGAVIGATHGGLQQGLSTYLRTGDAGASFAAAGEGALVGGTIGAVGGAASGAVLQSMGTSVSGALASGAAGGASAGVLSGIYTGARETGTVAGALEWGATEAVSGALGGAALGGMTHSLGTLSGKIRELPPQPVGIPEYPGVLVRTEPPVRRYGGVPTEAGMARHHLQPLSLGGADTPANIVMLPTSVHLQPHPGPAVKAAPIGTIFYR